MYYTLFDRTLSDTILLIDNNGSLYCSDLQVNPAKYKGMFQGFRVTIQEDGFRGLGKGWAPTLIGYSMQGLCKFGFYEVFKIFYANTLGEVRFNKNITF